MHACGHAGIQTSELNKEGIAYGHHCVQQVYMSDLPRIIISAKRHVDLWSLLGVHQVQHIHVIKGHSHGGGSHTLIEANASTEQKCLQLDKDKTIQ